MNVAKDPLTMDTKCAQVIENMEFNAEGEKLQTARTISLTGNVSGSATFDGSTNINISTTVNESKHAAVADTSTKIYQVVAGDFDIIAPGLGFKYAIAFLVDGKYSDCTIKLDTNTGYSENINISYDSNNGDEIMLGEISEQMFVHLKETTEDNGRVILTITVVP